ncbi:MAG: acetate/propionate family kinase [Burkholderiaceae bacterium]
MATAPASRRSAAGEPALHVLALNSGSSSLKFGLYRADASGVETLLHGGSESIGAGNGTFRARDAHGNVLASEPMSMASPREAIERIAALLGGPAMPALDVVGHRIVHGGPRLRQHCLIDAAVLRHLHAATAFAPLHTPAGLEIVHLAREQFADLPQVACFDTTFHAGMPERARIFAIPAELREQGIERYGFHGLSCESIVRQLGGNLPERLLIAHLGNGASITAVKAGRSIDTSMGLTPTGGVIMGTRSGDLDPGVLVYLMREKQFDLAQLADMVNHRGGLLGISGIASDMRELHAAAASSASARLAVEMFCYSVRKQFGAMSAALGGVDGIVFTGGIGENDALVRAAICDGLQWAGVQLDDASNQAGRNPLSEPGSRCTVQVFESQEGEQIAAHAWTLCRAPRA